MESANEKEVYQPPPELIYAAPTQGFANEKIDFNPYPITPIENCVPDLSALDSLPFIASKSAKSYKRGASHQKGLRVRYVCRVEGCEQSYGSSSAEKKHFSLEHIRPHECKICRQRFKTPKRVWRHLQKDHRLNLPDKPKVLSEQLGCPCCFKPATDRLAEDNPIGQTTTRPLNQQIGNPITHKPRSSLTDSRSKLWPSESLKKLKNLRPRSKKSRKDDSEPASAEPNYASHKSEQRNPVGPDAHKKAEGFLMVTTDQRKFVGVNLTGLETPRALLSKITSAVGLSDIHFPDSVSVQSFSPRYGAGKKLNDVQALSDMVAETLTTSGSLILYVSTSLLIDDRASRLDDDRLSSTLVASSHEFSRCSGSEAGVEKCTRIKTGKKSVEDPGSETKRLSILSEDQASEPNWRRMSSIQRTIDEVVRPAKVQSPGASERPSSIKHNHPGRESDAHAQNKREDLGHTCNLAQGLTLDGRTSYDAERSPAGSQHGDRPERTFSRCESFTSIDKQRDTTIFAKPPAPSIRLRTKGSITDSFRARWKTLEQPVSPVYDSYGTDFVKKWIEHVSSHAEPPTLDSSESPQGLAKWREVTLGTFSMPFRREPSSAKEDQAVPPVAHDTSVRRRKGWFAQALVKSREPTKPDTGNTITQRTGSIAVHHYIHDAYSRPAEPSTDSAADPVRERPSGRTTTHGKHESASCAAGQQPSTSPQQQHPPRFAVQKLHEQPHDDDDGSDERQNPKRRRVDAQGNSNSSNGRLPCIFAVAEPHLYPCHDRKFRYISQLLRHLNSHGFYACSKCFAKFDNEEQEEAHRNHSECSKACKDRKCSRSRPAGSSILPSRCANGCIRTPEQQWEQLFKLQYPEREMPAIFPRILPVMNPGTHQGSPITTSPGTLPSPLGRSDSDQHQHLPGINRLPDLRRENVPDLPTIVTNPEIFPYLNDGFDMDNLPHFLNIPAQPKGGDPSSLDSSPIESSASWNELQLLREKTRRLEKELQVQEWQLSQLDPRAEVLEEMLGKVWRALVNTRSPQAKPFTPLWLEMKRLAPGVVQQRSVQINHAGGQGDTVFQPSNNESGSSLSTMFDLPPGESSSSSMEDLGYGTMSTVQDQQVAQIVGDHLMTVDPKMLQIPVN